MPDIAQLGISVTGTESVQQANQRLDAFSAAADRAAKSVTDLGGAAQRSASGVKDAEAEWNRLESAMDRYQAAIDPVFRAQQKLSEVTNALRTNLNLETEDRNRANTIIAAYAKAVDDARASQEKHNGTARTAAEAAGGLSGAFKLTANEARNLSYQVNDVVTSLAAGISPMQVFAQQAGQIFQIFQRGGTGLSMIGPLAAVGAVAAGFIAAAEASARYDRETRQLIATEQAFAGATALSVEKIRDMAHELEAGGANTARSLEDAIMQSTRFREVGDNIRESFTNLAQNVAAFENIDLSKAMDELHQGFQQGAQGIDALNEKYGLLTDAQSQHVHRLQDERQYQEAINYAVQAANQNYAGIAKTLAGPVQLAWRDLKSAVGDAFNEMGRSDTVAAALSGLAGVVRGIADAVKTTAEEFQALDRLAAKYLPGISSVEGAFGKPAQSPSVTLPLNGYTGEAGDPQTAARQAAAARGALGNGASGSNGDADRRARLADANAMNSALKAQADALRAQAAGLDMSAAAALRARLQTEAAEKGIRASTQARINEVVAIQAGIDAAQNDISLRNQEANQKAIAETIGAEANQRDVLRAKLLAEVEARAQHYNAQETARLEAIRVAAVINQQDEAANDNLRTQQRATKTALEMADAYDQGGRHIANQTAALEAHDAWLKNAQTDEVALTRAILQRNAAQAVQGVAKTASSVQDQVEEQQGLAAATAQGAAAVAEYNRQQEVLRATLDARRAVEAAMYEAQQSGDPAAVQKADELNAALQQQVSLLDRATKARNLQAQQAQGAALVQQQTAELAGLKDQLATIGMLPAARQMYLDVLTAERDIQERMPGLTEDQRNAILDNVRAIDAAKDAAQQYQKAVDEWQAPFRDAAKSIQDSFGSLFEGIITKGLNSFKDFSDQLKNIFVKLAGQVAEQFLFNNLFGVASGGGGAGMFGGGGGNPAMGGLATLGYGSTGYAPGGIAQVPWTNPDTGQVYQNPGGYYTGAGGGNMIGSFIGGAALGYGAGQLTAGIGGRKGGQIGAAGGAMAGAAVGTMIFPGVGTVIGGLIGGIVGGLGGGFIGGHPSVGPGSAAYGDFAGGSYNLRVADADNGGDPSQAASALAQLAQGIQSLAQQTGGTLGNFGIHYGQNQTQGAGYQLRFGSQVIELGATPDLLNVLKTLISSGNLAGLSASEQTAIAHTQSQGDLSANIAFAQQYDAFVKQWQDGPLSQLQQALKDLGQQFEDSSKKAAQLGLDVSVLSSAYQQELQRQRDAYDKDIKRQIEAIDDPLQYQLDTLEDAHQQALSDAKALGADMAAVDQLYAEKRLQILQQSNDDALASIKSMTQSLQQELNSLTMGPQSALSPGEQYRQATAQFQALQSQIAANPGFVPTNINDVVNQYLTASKAINASGSGYVNDYTQATNLLQKLLGQNVTTPANQNTAVQTNNLLTQSNLSLSQIVDQIAALRSELVASQNVIARLMAGGVQAGAIAA